MRTLIAFTLALCLTGCALFSAAKTPQQTVYAAKTTYAVALEVAVTYKHLPSCADPGHPPICSKTEVIQALQKADNVAFSALDSAEQTVRTPGFGKDVYSSAASAAINAVSAFQAITSELGVKP